jgi:cytochrome b561
MTMATMPGVPAEADPQQAQRYAIRSYRMPAKVFHWLTVVLVVFMVSSAVIAKQLNDGYWSDTLFMLHKTTGVITLAVILMRLLYRIAQWWIVPQPSRPSRTALHWLLYAVIILIPLLGWAGISDFGSREIFPGFTLPAIWPERAGYADALFSFHAYLAFGLLALVAIHVGVATQDYMMRADDPEPERRD